MVHQKYPELDVPARILLSTGPTNVHPRVYKAMQTPVIGYGEAAFLPVIDGISSMLAEVFQTKESLTMALSATGSGGVEAGMASLLEPGDTVVIGSYGFFCERMAEMARRQGANVIIVKGEWARSLDPQAVADELKKHKSVKLVGMVHAETSTGVSQPLEEISRLAKEHDALFVVDAVTSFGGSEVAVDRWGVDYISSGSQKCLSCPPGLAPMAVSQAALDVMGNRKQSSPSWYLDLLLIANYWGKDHVYHHTAPISSLYAIYEGLRIVLEEGLEARFQRHQRNAAALRAGLEALGLTIISDKDHRLAQITPVAIPEGVDDGKVRTRLANDFKIEISRGLGQFAGKIWRIGLMGEASTAGNLLLLLSALEEILPQEGYEVPVGAGVAAASKALASS
ncbi:MAG: alanine--glyoxylate aminotransferase family protein [Chloroflexi bacterium]|nr:alanine--glyoxylate aminotransferase family protein [Chloroflexota bacterium]